MNYNSFEDFLLEICNGKNDMDHQSAQFFTYQELRHASRKKFEVFGLAKCGLV